MPAADPTEVIWEYKDPISNLWIQECKDGMVFVEPLFPENGDFGKLQFQSMEQLSNWTISTSFGIAPRITEMRPS